MTDIREFERATLCSTLKYSHLDLEHVRHGLPSLPARDWTYEEWSLHLESLARLLRNEGGRPDHDRVAVLVANALALMIAIERAELADAASGSEAA